MEINDKVGFKPACSRLSEEKSHERKFLRSV